MRFLSLTILFILFFSSSYSQEEELKDIEKTERDKKHTAIRLAPALFWNTIGLELEKQLSKRISIGLNTIITYGKPLDNNALVQATSQNTAILNQGMAIDLVGKRYLNTTFDQFFLFASVSYNSIEYFNVDKKPFTLFNQISENKKQEILETNTRVTNVYGTSFGVGYQMLIIPHHLIINIEGGIAGYLTVTNLPFFTLFITPSIGYKF